MTDVNPESRDAAEPQATGGEADVERLRGEREALQDQLQRTLADLQNIRKRHAREMEDARRRGMEALTAELLPVLDNFHLALEAHERSESGSARSETHSMVEGLQMVRKLLESVLERHGLAEIPATGEAFDPNRHEAVGLEPRPDLAPGLVASVLQRGYQFGERVLRPSKVVVTSAPEEGSASAGG